MRTFFQNIIPRKDKTIKYIYIYVLFYCTTGPNRIKLVSHWRENTSLWQTVYWPGQSLQKQRGNVHPGRRSRSYGRQSCLFSQSLSSSWVPAFLDHLEGTTKEISGLKRSIFPLVIISLRVWIPVYLCRLDLKVAWTHCRRRFGWTWRRGRCPCPCRHRGEQKSVSGIVKQLHHVL